jgi:hypothetical protein
MTDPSGAITVEEAVQREAAREFTPLEGLVVHQGYSRDDHWYRVDINGGEFNEWMALELSNPRLGQVTLYSPLREGGFRAVSVGVREPFWNRTMPGISPAFPVRVVSDQDRTFYLRVKNYGSHRFDLRLWSLSEHNRHTNFVLAGALLIAGALMVLALYNFCIYLHLRQPGYLWIAAFLVACTLWQMTASGTANMFLWPNAPVWSRHALMITGAIALLIGTCMANVLLETRRLAPRAGRVNVGLGLISATGALLTLADNPLALYFSLAGGILIPFMVTGLAIHAMRQGSSAGLSFLLSWGLVLIGSVVTNLIGPGYIPANTFTINFMDFALLGACLSWSFALTGRLKVHEHEQRRILEVLVKERTAELESALDAVKTLHGLLPICSCCKKIRNDQGYWQHVESYLQEHTEADFSHGICPDCGHLHYPEYFPKSGDAKASPSAWTKEDPPEGRVIE